MNDGVSHPGDESERRLREALHAEAESVTPPADAWDGFLRRLPDADSPPSLMSQRQDVDVPAAEHVGSQAVVSASAPALPRRSGAWRPPLVAAAAVVAIAVVTGLAISHGRSGDAASHSPAACNSATMIWVPVDDSDGVRVSPGDGRAPTSEGGGASTSPPGGASVAEPSTATPMATLGIGFDGTPPTASLCVRPVVPADGLLGAVHSDDTPLGYLSVVRSNGRHYLVAAVGPGVAQVQVQAMPSAAAVSSQTRLWASMMSAATRVTTDIDPGFAIASEMWMVDGGEGTPWSDAGTTTRWTSLGNGWHGFALAVPDDAVTVQASTLGANGEFTQVRTIDVSTGDTSDDAPPVGTAVPSPWTSSPAGWASTTSRSEVPAERTTDSPADGTTVGVTSCATRTAGGLGLSDVGFELAGVEFGADGAGGLCFLDGSTKTWTRARARSGPISAVGITGPGRIVNQATGTGTTGRLVWGAVSTDVATVSVTSAAGKAVDASAGLVALGTGNARVFLFTAPATGPVTVTAQDSAGDPMDVVTLR